MVGSAGSGWSPVKRGRRHKKTFAGRRTRDKRLRPRLLSSERWYKEVVQMAADTYGSDTHRPSVNGGGRWTKEDEGCVGWSEVDACEAWQDTGHYLGEGRVQYEYFEDLPSASSCHVEDMPSCTELGGGGSCRHVRPSP